MIYWSIKVCWEMNKLYKILLWFLVAGLLFHFHVYIQLQFSGRNLWENMRAWLNPPNTGSTWTCPSSCTWWRKKMCPKSTRSTCLLSTSRLWIITSRRPINRLSYKLLQLCFWPIFVGPAFHHNVIKKLLFLDENLDMFLPSLFGHNLVPYMLSIFDNNVSFSVHIYCWILFW